MDRREVLKIISDIFEKYSVTYGLIGAFAAAAWGAVRATKDIDFLADIPQKLVEEAEGIFKKNGVKAEIIKPDIDDPVRGVLKLTFTENGKKDTIDIVLGIKGVSADIYKNSRKLPFFGINVPVLSPENIIILKLIAGGPLDIDDAKKIFAVMKGKLDLEYLETECKKRKLDLRKIC